MLEDLEKVPLSGEDTKYESVAVDYETWRVLVRWSEEFAGLLKSTVQSYRSWNQNPFF